MYWAYDHEYRLPGSDCLMENEFTGLPYSGRQTRLLEPANPSDITQVSVPADIRRGATRASEW